MTQQERIKNLLQKGDIPITVLARKANINRTCLSAFANGNHVFRLDEKIDKLKVVLTEIGNDCINAVKD